MQLKSSLKTKTKILIGVDLVAIILFGVTAFSVSSNGALCIFVMILLLYHLKTLTATVTIDKNGIMVNNWFTIESRQYTFDQFDSVVVHVDPIESLDRYDLYLLKEDVIFCKIKGNNYGNTREIISAINRWKDGA